MISVWVVTAHEIRNCASSAVSFFTVLLLIIFAVPSLAQESMLELAKRSDVIVTGKVVRLGGTSITGVPESRDVIEIEVSEVLVKRGDVSLAAGDTVAVKVRNLDDFHVNSEVTFYAQGWIVGAGIAVIEVSHTLIAPATGAPGQDESADNQSENLAKFLVEESDANLRQRLQMADRVIEGRVRAIANVQVATSRGGANIVSEHDPEWQEALLDVTSTMKGTPVDLVIIRFPSSNDVAWFGVPKLSEGQEGIFVLTEDKASGMGLAVARGGIDIGAFTALQETDVLTLGDSDRVRRLVEEE